MLLSAVFYPGAGQIAQRRWVAGIFYVLAATVILALLFMEILVPLHGMLQWSLDLAANRGRGVEEVPSISFARVLIWFAVMIFVYAANLVDAALAQRRIERARRESALPEQMEDQAQ